MMKIKDICIGDSQIKEYKLENETLTMILQDYTDTQYEIIMNGCDKILVKGSVGFNLSEGHFIKNEIGERWCFYDEDGAVMELGFDKYTIRKIEI